MDTENAGIVLFGKENIKLNYSKYNTTETVIQGLDANVLTISNTPVDEGPSDGILQRYENVACLFSFPQ